MGSLLCAAVGGGSAGSPLPPDADRVHDARTCKHPCEHPPTDQLLSAPRGWCRSKELCSAPFPEGWHGDGTPLGEPRLSCFPASKGEWVALHPFREKLYARAGCSPFSTHSFARTRGLSEILGCVRGICHFGEYVKEKQPKGFTLLLCSSCQAVTCESLVWP